MDMAMNGLGVRQASLRVAFAINQLKDAENFAFAVFHGQGDQGAGAVAGLFVERRAELEGPGLGNTVGVC